jgi:hypothetical protein
MDRRKEPLEAIEALFPLEFQQVVLVTLSRLMPAACNQCGITGDIFLLDEVKACLFDEPFIDARRHEQKEADGAPHGQFVIGHRTGDHHRIRENGAMPGAQDAVPFPEHRKAIGKVIHRVDTDHRIEGLVVERQAAIGIRDGEAYAVRLAGLDRHL